jgi:ornithine decarboxylase
MYYELFTLPWILMDTLWAYFNLTDVLSDSPSLVWIACSAFFGIAAILIEIDCVRRLVVDRNGREACLNAAETLWVAGNVMWMLQDSLTHWRWMYVSAVWLFLIGTVFVFFSLVQSDVSAVPGTEEDNSIRGDSIANNVAFELNIHQSVNVNSNVPALASCGITNVVEKKRPRRSRGLPRLLKHVTIVPKNLPNQASNFSQIVARLALNSLNEPEASITLLDLGYVTQRLAEWRTFMPRVHPHYAVRSHADKKVVQLLSQLQCGFACATAEEVALALSRGASPEDIIFSGACSRRHLDYIKEAGVRLIPFEDAAELRKVAALGHSTAQLLLQLAPSSLSPSQQRKEWGLLLDLAVELGLHVSGISLGTGPGREEYGNREEALRDARDVFALATEKGFSMELIDLGNVDISKLTTFQSLAETIQDQLARWLPNDSFSTLRVIACPGQLFTRCASALLTRVVAKDVKPESNASPNITYVLNDGLYGGFAGVLADRTQLIPPQAVGFEKQDQVVQRCQFLGPGRDQFDVVLKDATAPEFEEGDWLIWPSIGQRASASCLRGLDPDDEDDPRALVWYYAEAGHLPEDQHELQ